MPSSKAVVVCGVLTKGGLFHCSIQADGDSVSHDSGRDGSLTTQLSEIITEGRSDALEARAVRMACNVDGRSAKLHAALHAKSTIVALLFLFHPSSQYGRYWQVFRDGLSWLSWVELSETKKKEQQR